MSKWGEREIHYMVAYPIKLPPVMHGEMPLGSEAPVTFHYEWRWCYESDWNAWQVRNGLQQPQHASAAVTGSENL